MIITNGKKIYLCFFQYCQGEHNAHKQYNTTDFNTEL